MHQTDCNSLVLGIDIGFRNTGWSLAEIKNKEISVVDCGCIHVKPKNTKYKGSAYVLEGAEMLDRISSSLMLEDVKAIAIETPGGNTQSASAAKALGACAVLVGALYNYYGNRTVLIKPLEVKRIVKAKGPVTKSEVMEYVINNYEVIGAPRKSNGDMLLKSFEHIADSVLVLEAAKRSSKIFQKVISSC